MLTVVPVRVQDYNVTDGSFVCAHLNAAVETSHFLSVFRYARDFNDRSEVQRFVLSMRLLRHDFYMLNRNITCLTALGA